MEKELAITLNLKSLKEKIPENIKIIAVSKAQTVETIMDIYNANHRIFGENRVQEIVAKKNKLPEDISWHFIGHLQSNKVNQIVPFVDLIHGVDSVKLLEIINKEAEKINRTVNCLLQVHIAKETTKFGFTENELIDFLSSKIIENFKNIKILGLMGMATFTDDEQQVRQEFRTLKRIFVRVKTDFFAKNQLFKELSMGMSDDYKIAIDEGSTIVRIGSGIFGQRF